MTQVQQVRETDRSLEEVFAYVSDFSTTAEWDPGVRSAHQLNTGPIGEGTRFTVEVVFLGRVLPMEYQIIAYDPPHRVELQGTNSNSTARDIITFETVRDRTRITWTLDIELRGPSRILQPLMGLPLRRLGRKALDGLAARLDRPGPL
jgi:carbon monoxide dehydrogenase subunit G